MRGNSPARRAIDNGQTPVRLYAIESAPLSRGSLADHHFSMKSSAIPALAYQLATACGVAGAPAASGAAPDWLNAVAQDLTNAKGRCVVIPGEFQPESVHLAAYAINAALGNVGKTVRVLEGVEPENTHHDRRTHERSERRPCSRLLLILGPNPVYTAPASLDFVRCDPQSALGGAAGAVLRRDLALEPLAHSGGALPRDVVRFARLRWHGNHSAAADRASVWRQIGARDPQHSVRASPISPRTTS